MYLIGDTEGFGVVGDVFGEFGFRACWGFVTSLG